MPKKPKFHPEVTRVRLNPEQAVLVCSCYNNRRRQGGGGTQLDSGTASGTICISRTLQSYGTCEGSYGESTSISLAASASVS